MDLGKVVSNINKASFEAVQNTKKDGVQDSSPNKAIEIQSQRKVDSKELEKAVDRANKVLFKNNTHLQFRIHDATKEVMVKIINDETGEVLKEIPPEKMLDMVAKLWEIAGIIVDEKR
ncbi:flagellar protein FlaG [Caloramator quimbayensis]|uniref:Flagellar protein FlaG n=1 Tax=Caloramator quimbayensis TaxID=1147123 RepID=A0A1T4X9M3_9CLOT|nr:flagellar protein FlaG [Caloramator quimbayensis]SKA86290.1 flagellar protein FlaG [Caloramator quimbayensis]